VCHGDFSDYVSGRPGDLTISVCVMVTSVTISVCVMVTSDCRSIFDIFIYNV